jgi:uncharacterized membrane protein (UPF0127 family)
MMTRLKSFSPAVLIGGVAIIIVAAALLFILNLSQATVSLYLGDGVFKAKVDYTQADREKGFGGASTIAATDGLILAFPSDSKWQIWMKDMQVPIDIVWLDSNEKVVYIVENAPPDGGESTVYTPTADARYVVEFAAGTVQSKSIKTGQSAVFDIDQGKIQ